MLRVRVIFAQIVFMLVFDFCLAHLHERANETKVAQNVTKHLMINTSLCSWHVDNTHSYQGYLTSDGILDNSFNNGTYYFHICHFHFHVPIVIGKSASVELQGRNSLKVSSSETIVVASHFMVQWTSSSSRDERWLGGFCTRFLDGDHYNGQGPGGGYYSGSAGHGGMGTFFRREKHIKYGWSYGYDNSHVQLIGGSSGGLLSRKKAVSCGGGAIEFSSSKTVVIDATICTNAHSLLFNESCVGGGSGGTIIVKAKEVNLTSNAVLLSRGAAGTYTSICFTGSGSGGVIVINGTVRGPTPDPRNHTALLGRVANRNGAVIINGVSRERLPLGANGADYIGCYTGILNRVTSALPDYKVRPLLCKNRCRELKQDYAALQETLCHCRNEISFLTKANESVCNLRCFGDYRFKCGGRDTTTIFYSIFNASRVSKPSTSPYPTHLPTPLDSVKSIVPSLAYSSNPATTSTASISTESIAPSLRDSSNPAATSTVPGSSESIVPSFTESPAPSFTDSRNPSTMLSTISESRKSTNSSVTDFTTPSSTEPVIASTTNSTTSCTKTANPVKESTTPKSTEVISSTSGSSASPTSSLSKQFPTASAEFSSHSFADSTISKVSTTVKVIGTASPTWKESTAPSVSYPTSSSITESVSTKKITSTVSPTETPSEKIRALAAIPITKNNSDYILATLRSSTDDVTVSSTADLNITLSILGDIVSAQAISTKNVKDSIRVGQNVLAITDKLLNNNTLPSWDVLEKKEKKTPEMLLMYVEDIMTSLGSRLETNETLNLTSSHFGVRMEVVSPLTFDDQNYVFFGLNIERNETPLASADTNQLENVFIPSSLINSVQGSGPFTLTLLKYQPTSPAYKRAALAETGALRSSLDSSVIAISLSRALKEELKENVVLTFPKTKDDNKSSRKSCRFLDFQKRTTATWSTRGCKTSIDEQGNVVCSCNHFTHFAVLLEVEHSQVDHLHRQALSWITYLGCGVSLVCLVLTLCTIIFLKSFTSDHTMIHCNLVVSLTLVQLVFLFGIRATDRKIICKMIAIFLHYLCTAAFCWMCVEGIHLYRKVIKVFIKANNKKYYYIFGWGAPALIVSLSALTRLDGYGNEKACWLSIESGLIWAFAAPVLGVLAVNFMILFLVIRVMLVAVNTIPPQRETSSARAGVKGIIILLPILGLTWLFGLLAVNNAAVVFQYMFTLLNSLQGFFIFTFHCVCNSEVRAALRRRQEKSSLQRSFNDSHSKSKGKISRKQSKAKSSLKRSIGLINVRACREVSAVET